MLILVGVPALLLTLWFGLPYIYVGPVGWKVNAAVKDGAQRIEMGRMTDFSWTALYVFGPYAPRAHVCAALEGSCSECDDIAPPFVDEGSYLLVFRDGPKVVTHEEFGQWTPSFDAPVGRAICRDQAVFVVLRVGPDQSGTLFRYERAI